MDQHRGEVCVNLSALALTVAHAKTTPRSFPPKCFKKQEIPPRFTAEGKRGSEGKPQEPGRGSEEAALLPCRLAGSPGCCGKSGDCHAT